MKVPYTLPLNGRWHLHWSEFSGEPDRPVDARTPVIEARVPGDVHLDLMRAGWVEDPFHGFNADRARWVEMKDWWYRRRFRVPADTTGMTAFLVFHGLDCFATIWLNGEKIARCANMFIAHEFDVTRHLAHGETNELVVRLAAPAYSIRIDPVHAHAYPVWSPERLFCRKAQMSFGWDIAPRLVTVGIWRPVELVFHAGARIRDAHLTLLGFEGHDARVRLSIELECFDPEQRPYELGVEVGPLRFSSRLTVASGIHHRAFELTIPDAPRWEPIGHGRPRRLPVTISLRADGATLGVRKFHTGLRQVQLVRERQASGGESFRFRVNGRDLFVTGFNWTPLDAIFARISDQKITTTLRRLAQIGCNMLRVWGGGIYETERFYSECDRLGILVWQDFMMSCGWYPQTDEFGRELEREARWVVRQLRRHPCRALWCGDNEVDMMVPTEVALTNRWNRQLLPAICAELDPETPYIPTSPWSPSGAHWSSQTEGDYHCYAHGQNHRESPLWTARCRFMSEFGRLALPSMQVIRTYFPRGTEWPLTSPMWRYHGTDTTMTGFFRVADRVLDELRASGRRMPQTLRDAVRASQQLQAEAIVELIERYSEDPEFGGFLIWNVADCWPQQSDALIDYLGIPKTAFRRLAAVFRRVRQRAEARWVEKPTSPLPRNGW